MKTKFKKVELTNQYNANKEINVAKEMLMQPGDILTLFN